MKMTRLEEKYQKEVVPKLQKELGLKNPWAVPRLEKVVVNVGAGQAVADKAYLDKVLTDLTQITGQKAAPTPARKSVAGFKLRAGQLIGAKVTLRRQRMFEFLDKLFNIVLPRVRDFQGLPLSGLDGHGNYSLGLPEQTVFTEIDPSQTSQLRGLQITIVTTAQDNKSAEKLLRGLGMPLREETKEPRAT